MTPPVFGSIELKIVSAGAMSSKTTYAESAPDKSETTKQSLSCKVCQLNDALTNTIGNTIPNPRQMRQLVLQSF
jgi:hypothetical protein